VSQTRYYRRSSNVGSRRFIVPFNQTKIDVRGIDIEHVKEIAKMKNSYVACALAQRRRI
jgi:hypothetical protein